MNPELVNKATTSVMAWLVGSGELESVHHWTGGGLGVKIRSTHKVMER